MLKIDDGSKNDIQSFPFPLKTISNEEGFKVTFFDIEDVSEAMSFLDSRIERICSGPLGNMGLTYTKEKLKELFAPKLNDSKWLYGATAELFCHLYLNHYGYRQNSLYLNLEEGSIKKGFDGLYSREDTIWLMESKSGKISPSVDHYNKITEAWRGLESMVSGRTKNDPWFNARNHAILSSSSDSILRQIANQAELYSQKTYSNLSCFNTIPCATIFCDYCPRINCKEIYNQILSYLDNKEHSCVHAICISHAAIDSFLDYLELQR